MGQGEPLLISLDFLAIHDSANGHRLMSIAHEGRIAASKFCHDGELRHGTGCLNAAGFETHAPLGIASSQALRIRT